MAWDGSPLAHLLGGEIPGDPEPTDGEAGASGVSPARWEPLIVPGDRVRFRLRVAPPSGADWSGGGGGTPLAGYFGFRLWVAPLRGLCWLRDAQVLRQPSLEWACWVLGFLSRAVATEAAVAAVHSPAIVNALVHFLRTPSVPFKARVVDLLTQLLLRPELLAAADSDALVRVGTLAAGAALQLRTSGTVFLPPALQAVVELGAAACVAAAARDEGRPARTRMDAAAAFTDGGVFSRRRLRVPVAKVVVPPEASLLPLAVLMDVMELADCLRVRARLPDRLTVVVAAAVAGGWGSVDGAASGRIEASRVGDRRLEDVVRAAGDEWTVAMDEALIRFARDMSARGVVPGALDAQPPTAIAGALVEALARPELAVSLPALAPATLPTSPGAAPGAHVAVRWAVLQLLNRRLAACVDLVDLSRAAVAPWSLAARLRSVGHVMFPDAKARLVEAAIDATWAAGRPHAELTLDNTLAFATRDARMVDAARSNCLFVQAFRQLRHVPGRAFRGRLDERGRLFHVHYRGEEGLDWGGLYRDALERMIEDVFSPNLDLLLPTPNAAAARGPATDKFVPNPRHHSPAVLPMFRFLGRILGVAIRQRLYMPFALPAYVWKKLVGQTVELADLGEVDLDAATRITRIARAAAAAEAADPGTATTLAGETFTITGFDGALVELVPRGADTPVTAGEARTFARLASTHKLSEVDAQIAEMRAGLLSVIPPRVLGLCSWLELELLACGDPFVDVEVLRAHTQYVGYSAGDRVVRNFWTVLGGFTNDERQKFLRFVWARSRLPKAGAWERPFKLTHRGGGDAQLPLGHACFNQLELPAYSSEAVMRQRLLAAVHYGLDGFHIA
jgi:hypothetical protein